MLNLLDDETAAYILTGRLEMSLVARINRAVSVGEAGAFLEGPGGGTAVMFKALAGGGGYGMCTVGEVTQLVNAYRRYCAEA